MGVVPVVTIAALATIALAVASHGVLWTGRWFEWIAVVVVGYTFFICVLLPGGRAVEVYAARGRRFAVIWLVAIVAGAAIGAAIWGTTSDAATGALFAVAIGLVALMVVLPRHEGFLATTALLMLLAVAFVLPAYQGYFARNAAGKTHPPVPPATAPK